MEGEDEFYLRQLDNLKECAFFSVNTLFLVFHGSLKN